MRNAEGITYAFLNLFIYDQNAIFKPYTKRGRDLRYYMIDFRNIYTIQCPLIKRSEELTTQDPAIIKSKVLQLSIQARTELREKIGFYYTRVQLEDLIQED